ncbi:MAG: hypothetical protein A2189_03670 [Paenibacillus sp. RIFOXYA1_FULL_44_5]|nr:MAG: hypothetical protein A2189_03670 [Paenibacillus sp. RIFOXYA1_FULL_44_5]
MQTKGVQYRRNADGSIDFVDKKGKVNFKIPQMWVQDASSNIKRYDRLSINVKQKGNKTYIEMTFDDKGLQYPVVIDPTTILNNGFSYGGSYTYDKLGRVIYSSIGQSCYYDSNGNLVRRFTSLAFNGTNQVPLNNIAVNTAAGAKNTVEFWMFWDGTDNVMPFSWNGAYDLWFSGGYFGFNTGENNVLGISSANLKNKWVHVAATFYNGVPDVTNNELYINGIKQSLVAEKGSTTLSKGATSSAAISGSVDMTGYMFSGRIGEVRIWNYPLSQTEVQGNMYRVFKGNETGLVIYWTP